MIDQQWLTDCQLAAPLGVFVEGERCTWHGETAVQLGRLLGQLHSLQPPTNVPDSWYHPLPRALAEAAPGLAQFPQLTDSLANAAIVTDCPVSLIHADLWHGNIIASRKGQLTLIDWEYSGLGHSILDLADVAADCASVPLLKALLHSYETVRSLSAKERTALVPAMQIAIAIRVAKKVAANRYDSIPRELERFARAPMFRAIQV